MQSVLHCRNQFAIKKQEPSLRLGKGKANSQGVSVHTLVFNQCLAPKEELLYALWLCKLALQCMCVWGHVAQVVSEGSITSYMIIFLYVCLFLTFSHLSVYLLYVPGAACTVGCMRGSEQRRIKGVGVGGHAGYLQLWTEKFNLYLL